MHRDSVQKCEGMRFGDNNPKIEYTMKQLLVSETVKELSVSIQNTSSTVTARANCVKANQVMEMIHTTFTYKNECTRLMLLKNFGKILSGLCCSNMVTTS